MAECKRLYSAAQCDAMTADLHRVLQFQPRDEEIADFQRFGMLAATTWDDRIARWWSSRDTENPTSHDHWGKMRAHPALQTAHWGSVVLLGYEAKRPAESPFHYLLYTVFEMKPAA